MKKIVVSFWDTEESVVTESYEIVKAISLYGSYYFLVYHNNDIPIIISDLSSVFTDILKTVEL